MTTNPTPKPINELFGKFQHDVEHAFSMYAISCCTIPAEGLYDNAALKPLMNTIESCHIYLIGFTPNVAYIASKQEDRELILSFEVAGKQCEISYEIPDGYNLINESEPHILENESGEKCWPNSGSLIQKLSEVSNAAEFNVKYIGQAYGEAGSRNALDRLQKHETLQEISLKGSPKGYRLTLIMLAIEPSNRLITVMNPFAKEKSDGDSRIKPGLDKLFNTTEEERVCLYEAALIRYFYPEYNVEFKDSFPSTKLKILQDCYEKDFSAVIAEICIDELPYRLFSDRVKCSQYHIAKHNLHKKEDRKVFFALE